MRVHIRKAGDRKFTLILEPGYRVHAKTRTAPEVAKGEVTAESDRLQAEHRLELGVVEPA